MDGAMGLLRRRPGLVAAAAVTAVLVVLALLMRLGADPAATPLPERASAVLVAAALLIGGLLAVPRLPGLAWLFVALASAGSMLEVVGAVRGLETVATGDAWRDLLLIAGVTLAAGTLTVVAFAARGRPATPPARVVVVLVGAGAAATSVAAIWAVAGATATSALSSSAELTPLRVAARLGIATVAAALVVGVVRDLWAPAVRARDRMGAALDRDGAGLWRFLGLLTDELLPGRSDGRDQAAQAERARLAADLHALVLPELRRAASAAEAAGAPEQVQVDLRRALEDVEQLMHERQSVVLEQFGLVAALEWLAERTEERAALRVELELEGDVPDQPDALEPAVARAAFRIALLALDNVVRHADASTATLRLEAGGRGLRLSVEDDGVGQIEPRSIGRGLPDMRSMAASTGGSIEFERGTVARIVAAWPASAIAANRRTRAAPLTDRANPTSG